MQEYLVLIKRGRSTGELLIVESKRNVMGVEEDAVVVIRDETIVPCTSRGRLFSNIYTNRSSVAKFEMLSAITSSLSIRSTG